MSAFGAQRAFSRGGVRVSNAPIPAVRAWYFLAGKIREAAFLGRSMEGLQPELSTLPNAYRDLGAAEPGISTTTNH
jgi:hypothetical protein